MADDDEAGDRTADADLTLLDDLNAPMLLVENIRGLQVRNGIVTLNVTNTVFGVPDSNHEGKFERTVCRLAMSPVTLAQFADFFGMIRDRLVADGVVENIEPPEPQE